MKNYLIKNLLFITVFFGFSLALQTQSFAVNCLKNADGAVIIDDVSASKPRDESSMSLATGTPNYDKNQCMVTPLNYRIKAYKLLLCTGDPYVAGGAAPNLESCTGTVFERTGTNFLEINIEKGKETALLDGDIALALGTYPYVYFSGSTHLAVKHYESFVRRSNGGAFTMHGYNNANASPIQNHTEGSECWTVEGLATTYTNTVINESGGIDGGSSPHTNSEGGDIDFTKPEPDLHRDITLTCGLAGAHLTETGAKAWGYTVEIVDSISATCDGDCGTTFGAHEDYSNESFNADIKKAFVLLQNDGTIATSRVNATKVGYIAKLAAPVIITENTIGFKTLFNTNSTVSLDTHGNNLGSSNSGLEAKKMGIDLFGIKFQTRERRGRRATTGAWR